MARLSRHPVISSGRRETSQTAALILSWQVSADWVSTTRWGLLRTFIYIWRERESQRYRFSSNAAGIFQRGLKQCLLFHMPLIQCLFLGASSVKVGLYSLLWNLSVFVTRQWWHSLIKWLCWVIKISHTFTLFFWNAHVWLSHHNVRKLNEPW